MKDSAPLRVHRVFSSLGAGELENLARGFSVFRCPPDSSLLVSGAPSDGLYLIETGVCRVKDGKDEYLKSTGDIMEEESLFLPGLARRDITALEECRVLFLSREYFLAWLKKYPDALKKTGLKPPDGWNCSGTPSLAVLKEKRVVWGAKTALWLLFPPLFFLRLFFRRRNGAFVDGRQISCRYFRLSGLKNTNLTIPLEQIQSVETEQKGIMSRILSMGHVLIRVNGPGGSLLLRNIPDPGKAQQLLLRLKRDLAESEEARKHGEIRREVAGWVREERGILRLEEGDLPPADSPEGAVFRKSLFVLYRKGWWQFLLSLACLGVSVWAFYRDADWSVFPLLALAGALFLSLYTLIDWLNDIYRVEEGYLLDLNREPFGRKMSRKQAELSSIQNVIAEQKGFWANVFDYGTVRVIVPGDGPGEGIQLEGVKRPRQVQERLLRERDRWMETLRGRERKSQTDDLKLYCRLISQELSEKDRS